MKQKHLECVRRKGPQHMIYQYIVLILKLCDSLKNNWYNGVNGCNLVKKILGRLLCSSVSRHIFVQNIVSFKVYLLILILFSSLLVVSMTTIKLSFYFNSLEARSRVCRYKLQNKEEELLIVLQLFRIILKVAKCMTSSKHTSVTVTKKIL